MKTELLLIAAAILCAVAVPLTCVSSPPTFIASAAEEDTAVAVVPIAPVVDDSAQDVVSVDDDTGQSEGNPGSDKAIDSIQEQSTRIDEDMSEIQKDIEELKKRKKIKKTKTITKKKIKKKVIDK